MGHPTVHHQTHDGHAVAKAEHAVEHATEQSAQAVAHSMQAVAHLHAGSAREMASASPEPLVDAEPDDDDDAPPPTFQHAAVGTMRFR